MEPHNFTNPVAARFVRVIPIQWVGASVCLRMELFGCTVKGEVKKCKYTECNLWVAFMVECQTISIIQPDKIAVSSSSNISDQVLNISSLSYWCASAPGPQNVILSYNKSVYLTQAQVRSNSVIFSIYQHTNQTLYQNEMRFSVS